MWQSRSILEKREDLCINGLRNTIKTYGLHVLRPQPFQNMLTSSDIIRFGTRLNLFIYLFIFLFIYFLLQENASDNKLHTHKTYITITEKQKQKQNKKA